MSYIIETVDLTRKFESTVAVDLLMVGVFDLGKILVGTWAFSRRS